MTCQPDTFQHKQGASFQLLARIPSRFADGHFAGWVPTAQVRTVKGELISDLDVEWDDPSTARVLVLRKLDTAAWPVGEAQFDVRLTGPDGFVMATSTQVFYVIQGATRA